MRKWFKGLLDAIMGKTVPTPTPAAKPQQRGNTAEQMDEFFRKYGAM